MDKVQESQGTDCNQQIEPNMLGCDYGIDYEPLKFL